jgi:hypothetical protein
MRLRGPRPPLSQLAACRRRMCLVMLVLSWMCVYVCLCTRSSVCTRAWSSMRTKRLYKDTTWALSGLCRRLSHTRPLGQRERERERNMDMHTYTHYTNTLEHGCGASAQPAQHSAGAVRGAPPLPWPACPAHPCVTACVSVCAWACVSACAPAGCVCLCACARMPSSGLVCLCAFMRACVPLCRCACVPVCAGVRACACVCTCARVHRWLAHARCRTE